MKALKKLRPRNLDDLGRFFKDLPPETVRELATRLVQAQFALCFVDTDFLDEGIANIKKQLTVYIQTILEKSAIRVMTGDKLKSFVTEIVDKWTEGDCVQKSTIFTLQFLANFMQCQEKDWHYFSLFPGDMLKSSLKSFYQREYYVTEFKGLLFSLFMYGMDTNFLENYSRKRFFPYFIRNGLLLWGVIELFSQGVSIKFLTIFLGFLLSAKLVALTSTDVNKLLASSAFDPLYSGVYREFFAIIDSAICEERSSYQHTNYEPKDLDPGVTLPVMPATTVKLDSSNNLPETELEQSSAEKRKKRAATAIDSQIVAIAAYAEPTTIVWSVPSSSNEPLSITYREGDMSTNVYRLWGKSIADDTYYLYWRNDISGFTSDEMYNHFQRVAAYAHVVAPVAHAGVVITDEKDGEHRLIKLKSESKQFGDFRVYCRFFAETEYDGKRRILYQTASVEREEGHKYKNN
jgi:hypothetical protein